jgi:hypothetical protein
MTATRAFDLALFVPTPVNSGDGVVVDVPGPPFTTKFAPLVTGSKSGVVVGASMPAPNAQNQILISGPGPTFAWVLGVNPAAAASVPPATAQSQVIISDASLQWQDATIAQLMTLGGAVTVSAGGTFGQFAELVFSPTASPTVRIDGGDPNFSTLDNFTIDAGTF